jgi:hypothetical protein
LNAPKPVAAVEIFTPIMNAAAAFAAGAPQHDDMTLVVLRIMQSRSAPAKPTTI